MDLVVTGNMEQDVITNTRAAVKLIEVLIDDCPDQYLWFYKVYKYTTQHKTVILDRVPTAENLARIAFERLDAVYRDTYGNHLRLEQVRLYETPNCWADALRTKLD